MLDSARKFLNKKGNKDPSPHQNNLIYLYILVHATTSVIGTVENAVSPSAMASFCKDNGYTVWVGQGPEPKIEGLVSNAWNLWGKVTGAAVGAWLPEAGMKGKCDVSGWAKPDSPVAIAKLRQGISQPIIYGQAPPVYIQAPPQQQQPSQVVYAQGQPSQTVYTQQGQPPSQAVYTQQQQPSQVVYTQQQQPPQPVYTQQQPSQTVYTQQPPPTQTVYSQPGYTTQTTYTTGVTQNGQCLCPVAAG